MSVFWKSALKRGGLACVAAALAFLFVDGAVRVWARVTRQVPPETVLFTHDPVLQARWHQPNSSAIVTFRGTAPHRVSFNEHGFRGTRPTALVKAPGTTRIVILGESSTEDGLVEDGKTWPELLEARLNARLGTNRVEILNLGCAGYSMAASLRNLQVNGLKFKPDMVILYHGNNDFWKAFMAHPHLQRMETYIDYEARQTTWWSRLLCKSILVDRISRRLYYANMERNRICLRAYRDVPEASKRDLEMAGIETEARRELGRIAEVCATNGIRLVIGIQASLMKEQLNERELYAMWEVLRWSYDGDPITWRTFVDGPQRVKTMQRNFARDQGLLCIDVEAAVPKTIEHFVDHIHSTEAGSASIAAAFADGLIAVRILERKER